MVAGEEDSRARPLLHIPSHSQVSENSRPQPPPSFFRPSSSPADTSSGSRAPSSEQQQYGRAASSFTEAFSFVRQTEFYTAPPPAPAAPAPSASEGGPESGVGPKPQEASPSVSSQARNAILVNRRQTGNPVLKYIRNVRWVYGDIVPDYLLGQTTCALYISLRYHLLHPDYLYFRIRELQKGFRLRVILCHVDLEDVIKPLHEVIKTCLLHDCSLLCAWSLEECARYLETLKTYENKPADNIQERTDSDYISRMTSALTSVRHVNKTDVLTLGSTFMTLAGIFGASMDELARCPGIGERKVKRLYDAFHEPFRRTTKQLQLDNAVVKISQAANTELNTPVDSTTKPVDSVDTDTGANASKTDEPDLSVRKALDAAYAKAAKRKVGSRKETSMKDMCTDSTKIPSTVSDTEGAQQPVGTQAPKWRTCHAKFRSIGAAVMSCRNEKPPEGVAAHAHLADGLLHLILIRECSRPGYLRQLLRLTRRGADPFDFSFVEHYKTPLFTLKSHGDKESVWNVDGELLIDRQITGQVFRGLVTLFPRVRKFEQVDLQGSDR